MFLALQASVTEQIDLSSVSGLMNCASLLVRGLGANLCTYLSENSQWVRSKLVGPDCAVLRRLVELVKYVVHADEKPVSVD